MDLMKICKESLEEDLETIKSSVEEDVEVIKKSVKEDVETMDSMLNGGRDDHG